MESSVIYKIVKRGTGELAGGHYYEDWRLNYAEQQRGGEYKQPPIRVKMVLHIAN